MGNTLTGTKGQPVFNTTPSTVVDLQADADYAALVGNWKIGTTTQRNAATGVNVWEGLNWWDTTLGSHWRYLSGGWVLVAATRGNNRLSTPLTIASASTWTDVCTVSVSPRGGLCVATWNANVTNANSGVAQIASFRVLLDGVAMSPTQLDYDLPLKSGANSRYAAAFDHESTPTAGSHTWKLQAFCTSATAIQVIQASLTVREG